MSPLIEKGDKLGGRLHEISCLSFKFDMRRHLQWLMSSTMECGAKIMLNTEATPEIIMGLKPDAVFVATGAERLSLPIPGIDREMSTMFWMSTPAGAAVGERVVVCGGGLSRHGVRTPALPWTARRSRSWICFPVEQFAQDHSPAPRGMLPQLLEKYGVELIGSVRVCGIDDGAALMAQKRGTRTVIPGDDVVAAFGMEGRMTLFSSS